MSDHLHALPAGHLLGEYRIDDVLGSGGFGITYLAWDTQLEKRVAIKEYLPIELALRTDAATVHPKSTTHQADYQWGLDRFLDEARTLARFEHPHLNKVHRFFAANGTAYMVLEYIEGETLAARLKREGQLDAARLRRLLDELLAGLEQAHAVGFIHRDIKPANVMPRSDGAAALLDFGAARQAIGQRSNGTASMLAPGCAPIEQYDPSAADVGPWSDLYALGMVAYRCLLNTRKAEIPDAVTRAVLERKGAQHEDLAPAVVAGKSRHNQALLGTADWAVKAGEEQRPQSAAAMGQTLTDGDNPVTAPASAAGQSPRSSKDRPNKRWRARSLSMLAAVGVAAAGVVGCSLVQEHGVWPAARGDAEESPRQSRAYPDGRHEAEAEASLTAAEAEIRLFTEIFGRAPSPDANDVDGLTDLHYVAAANMPELARFLLDAGAGINARMYRFEEPLSEISRRRLWELTKTNLFGNRIRSSWTPLYFAAWTPLHLAASYNAREVAELLIVRGANIHAKDGWGETPLHYAARRNAHQAAKLLIARGANIHAKDESGETPLHKAAWGNAREAAELLIARGANVNAKDDYGETPLHEAAWKNAREAAELLIARGANINAKDNSSEIPLHEAARGNAREVTKLLIARGANVKAKDNDGVTPLHWAAARNARQTAELLIARGANINAKNGRGRIPLHEAALGNARQAAELLIAHGTNVKAKDNDGKTPLHRAALGNARQAAELLIAHGTNVKAKDNDGETPLHDAAWGNAREAAELLIARGANVNAKDDYGETPLHDAAWENAPEAAELLIAHGANIDAATYSGGQTPLHYAAYNNAHQAAELLIARGANVNAKKNGGSRPRDLARSEELKQLLR